MGVEPTIACAVQPTTDFEDRGIHQDTTTPKQTTITGVENAGNPLLYLTNPPKRQTDLASYLQKP